MHKYKSLSIDAVIQNGVTCNMVIALAVYLYGFDEPLIDEDSKFIHEFKWAVQPNLLRPAGKHINVVYGRRHYASFPIHKDDCVNESQVLCLLQQAIYANAFRVDRCMAGLTEVVRRSYGKLRCDNRPDGSYRSVTNGMALCLRKEPVFRTDMDDIGREISCTDLHNTLYRFVPKDVFHHIEHMLLSYCKDWDGLYGGTPAKITYFTKQKTAGEQLYIIVGNDLCGVTFQFNRIRTIDKDNLTIHREIQSLIKDFT